MHLHQLVLEQTASQAFADDCSSQYMVISRIEPPSKPGAGGRAPWGGGRELYNVSTAQMTAKFSPGVQAPLLLWLHQEGEDEGAWDCHGGWTWLTPAEGCHAMYHPGGCHAVLLPCPGPGWRRKQETSGKPLLPGLLQAHSHTSSFSNFSTTECKHLQ